MWTDKAVEIFEDEVMKYYLAPEGEPILQPADFRFDPDILHDQWEHYKKNRAERIELEKQYPGSSITIDGTHGDKLRWNETAMTIADFEYGAEFPEEEDERVDENYSDKHRAFIYEELVHKYGKKIFDEPELPEFMRKEKLVNERIDAFVRQGWYQNSAGDLFHYDGVVWDNVPQGKIDDLEFLGG